MSDCCAVPHGSPPACPMNGQPCRPVPRRTVESLLRLELKPVLTPQPYFFCDAGDCDIVYVSALGDHALTKDQLIVRVGIKEIEDPIPLCYCFGYDRAAVRKDIKLGGRTDIQRTISDRVRSGECRCEERNPSGGCCLGEVSKAIKQAVAMKGQGLL